MSDDVDPAQEAADALRASGITVEPTGDDLALWLVDKRLLTDGDLLALAFRHGLMDGPAEVQ